MLPHVRIARVPGMFWKKQYTSCAGEKEADKKQHAISSLKSHKKEKVKKWGRKQDAATAMHWMVHTVFTAQSSNTCTHYGVVGDGGSFR